MPGATHRTLAALARLLEQVPAYELELGPAMNSVPDAVAAVAEQAGVAA